jgi:hypothetical protein
VDQNQQKKQLESLLVSYFKQACPSFPEGKLVESESPDFLLTLKNNSVVGIELTRLYPVSQRDLTLVESEQARIEEELVENAHFLFEANTSKKCFVKVQFSATERIKPEKVLSSSVRISRMILESVENSKETGFNRVVLKKKLPAGIDLILVLSHQVLQYSVWERMNNLGNSTDLLADIRYSIHKKDEKYRLYLKRQLSEYWLLITADQLTQEKPVNIQNLILNATFNSEFRKVFILELQSGNAVELV